MSGSSENPSWAHRKRFLQDLFRSRGRRPSRTLGQNFLLDPNLLDAIAGSAGIGPEDAVLEVGTGTGQMTARIAGMARAVVSVEIDRVLHQAAAAALAGLSNVRLLRADALAGKNRLDPAVDAAVREAAAGGGSLLLVSNLAYRIAAPLLLTLLESGLPFRRMSVLVPKELAEKFAARGPGDAGYGSISILAAFRARSAIEREVPPDVFWPRPKVVSAVLRIDVLDPGDRPAADLAKAGALVRAVFTQRRKTIARSLEGLGFCGRGEAAPLLAGLGLDSRARPEELAPEAFLRLADAFSPRAER